MTTTSRDDEFSDFVASRLPTLGRVAYLMSQDRHRADDLVQLAITRLYVNWDRARVMANTEGYLRTIMVREFLSERRSGWARRVSMDGGVPEQGGSLPDHDAALDLNAALAALPPRQRATLVLRFYCDLTIDQTAQMLGCTSGTVKSQTAKGLDALRRVLEPAGAIGSADKRPVAGLHTRRLEVHDHG